QGFGRNHCVNLLVTDDRFALQELIVETGGKQAPKPVTLPLSPPRRIKGRVLCADTGKPLANATLTALTYPRRPLLYLDVSVTKMVRGRTDAQGRFVLHPYVGGDVGLSVTAPAGTPYLDASRRVQFARATTQQQIAFTLARGVWLEGKVTE